MSFRIESDSMGEVKVPNDKHYAAQTVRSMMNFPICMQNAGHKMPKEVIQAMLYVKKAAAITNKELMQKDPSSTEFKKFSPDIADKIVDAVDAILADFDNFYRDHFPLVVWQTGSGTQTNMNVNEVIASVANEKATGKKNCANCGAYVPGTKYCKTWDAKVRPEYYCKKWVAIEK